MGHERAWLGAAALAAGSVLAMLAGLEAGQPVAGGADRSRPAAVAVVTAAEPAVAPAAAPVRSQALLFSAPRTLADVHGMRAAAAALDRDSVAALREVVFGEADPIPVVTALRTLGRLHAVAGDPQLLGLVQDPRPAVRQALVLALGDGGGAGSVPLLLTVADGEDAALRPLAIQALGRIGGLAAKAALAGLGRKAALAPLDAVFLRQALVEVGRAGSAGPVTVPMGSPVPAAAPATKG